MVLKKEREFNNPRWPFFIGVKDVKDRVLIGATFKRRANGATNPNTYDFTVQADEAEIDFDEKKNQVVVKLKNTIMQGGSQFTSAP